MNELRKKEIIQTVNAIIGQYGDTESKVDVVNVASKLGFKVLSLADEAPFKGIIIVNKSSDNSGIFSTFGNRIIAFKKNLEKRQNRFIMAHELGHYFLHSENLFTEKNIFSYEYHSSKSNDSLEEEANYFAANLLVPESLFKEKYAEYKNASSNNEILLEQLLSDFFDVDIQCIEKRILEVGI